MKNSGQILDRVYQDDHNKTTSKKQKKKKKLRDRLHISPLILNY